VFCVWGVFGAGRTACRRVDVSGLGASNLGLSLHGFCSRCDGLFCDCGLSLARVLSGLFRALCWTDVSVLVLAMGDPVCLISVGGARRVWRSVEDAWSCVQFFLLAFSQLFCIIYLISFTMPIEMKFCRQLKV
jgi:hypothetical protein